MAGQVDAAESMVASGALLSAYSTGGTTPVTSHARPAIDVRRTCPVLRFTAVPMSADADGNSGRLSDDPRNGAGARAVRMKPLPATRNVRYRIASPSTTAQHGASSTEVRCSRTCPSGASVPDHASWPPDFLCDRSISMGPKTMGIKRNHAGPDAKPPGPRSAQFATLIGTLRRSSSGVDGGHESERMWLPGSPAKARIVGPSTTIRASNQ